MRKLLWIALAVIVVLMLRSLLSPSHQVTNPEPRGDNIICFGDSLTAGTGAGPGESYPEQLSRRLGVTIINAGRPGDTTASALARLQRDVLDRSPRIVCITLGGNDLKNGVAREEAFANLEAIVRRGIPQWLEIDKEKFTGKVVSIPAREDITLPIQEQLIVELYSK